MSATGPQQTNRRPFQGWGTAIGKAGTLAAKAIGGLSARLYAKTRQRGGAAYEDFTGRPEHVRYRAYGFGVYGLIAVATLLSQLYTKNPLGSYVRIEHVDMPETVQVFVRNDSGRPWSHVRLQLNGIYAYQRERVLAHDYIQIKVDAFALFDHAGKMQKPPRNVHIDSLTIDADQGHTDVELPK